MAFLRSVAATTTTTTAIVATALPAAFALASLSPSSSLPSSPSSQTSKTLTFSSLSSNSILRPDHLGLVKSFAAPPPAIHMDAPSSDHKLSFQNESALPELLTEYLVDMNCDGCVTAVKHKLQAVDGVKNVEVDLSSQVVRILGSSPVKTMTEALEQTGRNARLIGQGVPEEASKSRVPEKDLQSLTVERLRALLKEKGLSLKGKKDELIARLRGVNGSS